MSENENKPCRASVLFEQGKIGLVVSAWLMPEVVSGAVLRNPKWDARNEKYTFEVYIEDLNKWPRAPQLGDVIVVRDDSDKKLAYGMVIYYSDSPTSNVLVVRRTFPGETPGASLLEKLFPGLLCTPTPLHMSETSEDVAPPGIAHPAELGALPRPAQVMPDVPLPGPPNCAAKVTLEDQVIPGPKKPFPKLPSDLELINAISERVGVMLPSPVAAEETLDHLEKIALRMQTCMENQGPDNVEIAQVWRSRGVCYLVTSIVDRTVGLHALEPTDLAIHGKAEGVVSHIDTIRRKFAWVGSVADAVKKGFIK